MNNNYLELTILDVLKIIDVACKNLALLQSVNVNDTALKESLARVAQEAADSIHIEETPYVEPIVVK